MKKTLLFLLLFALSQVLNAQQKKVAVYVTGDNDGVTKVLGSKLVSAIARSEQYSAIERTSAFLAELSKEQNYQRTGAVDDSEISRLGKQFGVQLICVASVTEAFGEQYVSARLIDVETAQVERSAGSDGSIQSLNDLMDVADGLAYDLLYKYGTERQSSIKKVAVYIAQSEAAKNIGKVLGDKLVSGFTNSGRYVAVERTNSFLSQLIKEQSYQRTGAVDDNDISRLGQQFGVRYVCVADVSDVFGDMYITARLIDVETAEVVNTHDVGGQVVCMGDVVQMANEIANNLSKGTFAEQAEEERIKAAEEARLREEREARIKAEQEARQRAEEEKERKKQTRINNRKQELASMLNNGYIIIKDPYKGEKWMVCINPIEINANEVAENRTYTRFGYSDWKIGDIDNVRVINLTTSEYLGSSKTQVEMQNYINGVSDEITYNFAYIVNEYIHYFDKMLPIFKTGYFWNGKNCRYWELARPCPGSMLFLDGENSTIWRYILTEYERSSDYDKKVWGKKTGLAILVRKM